MTDGQLFITEFDEVYLPQDYHFSHNFSVRLYDELVWILKDRKAQKRINVTIKYRDKENRPGKNEEDIISWLLKNGYEREANEVISKNTIFAIISDICHFIFQALDSAKRIKMTVAYTLIRKPFLENLLIIEQILAEEQSFLKRFSGKADDFDPGRLKDEEKRDLINKCLSKIHNSFINDAELIFRLRFDKNNPNSFYAMSNLAIHLVTTRYSEFRTESNNLNFIFSTYNEWNSQLDYFYYYVPYMLLYTIEIIDQLLLNKKIINKKVYKKRKFIRLFGQILQFEQFEERSKKGRSIINKLSRSLKIKCENCNKTNQLFKSDIYSLVYNNSILCKYCLINLSDESKSMEEAINKIIK